MRGIGAYVVAGLLVLASVPIYWKVYERYSDSHELRSVAKAVEIMPARRPSPGVSLPGRIGVGKDCPATGPDQCTTIDNSLAAVAALRGGNAKCVAGTIYRTYGHVIEPWPPGNLGCEDPYGMPPPRRGVGVQPLR